MANTFAEIDAILEDQPAALSESDVQSSVMTNMKKIGSNNISWRLLIPIIVIGILILILLIVAVILLTRYRQSSKAFDLTGAAYNYDGQLVIFWSDNLRNKTALITVSQDNVVLTRLSTQDNYLVLDKLDTTNNGITNITPITDEPYDLNISIDGQTITFQSENIVFTQQTVDNMVLVRDRQVLITNNTQEVKTVSDSLVDISTLTDAYLINRILYPVELVRLNGRKLSNSVKSFPAGTYTIITESPVESAIIDNILAFKVGSATQVVTNNSLVLSERSSVELLFGFGVIRQQYISLI